MTISSIEWTMRVWNAFVGCSRISDGCRNCYAEIMAWRHVLMCRALGRPCKYDGTVHLVGGEPRWTGKINFDPDTVEEPLRRVAPATWFVNSMSDLFHENVPDIWLDRMFAVMALAHRHTFQILTKRPERMRDYLSVLSSERLIAATNHAANGAVHGGDAYNLASLDGRSRKKRFVAGEKDAFQNLPSWPFRNVHLGVSVENDKEALHRIPILLQTPAHVRWVSYEPALGPVDFGLGRWIKLRAPVRSEIPIVRSYLAPGVYRATSNRYGALAVETDTTDGPLGVKPAEFERLPLLNWIVVGGESGSWNPARPFNIEWARLTLQQCEEAARLWGEDARVPVFVKQMGAFPIDNGIQPAGGWWPAGVKREEVVIDGAVMFRARLKDKKGGDPAEWPADLRRRELPRVA